VKVLSLGEVVGEFLDDGTIVTDDPYLKKRFEHFTEDWDQVISEKDDITFVKTVKVKYGDERW
jgi:hypothetical protein